MDFTQAGYIVNRKDCVGTAIGDIHPGNILLRGNGMLEGEMITAVEPIPFGHKFARRDLRKGEAIIKYGMEIAVATADIKKGEHIHLHNAASSFDLRAATFEADTANSTDMEYEVY